VPPGTPGQGGSRELGVSARILEVTSPTPLAEASPRRSWLRRLGYVVLNGWLCYHLFAIVVCPASVAPAAPIVQDAWSWVSGYLQALFLNHGFHFFSPDPAGSTVVEYTLEFADGSTRSGRLPDRSVTPRLRYHRHFMLTEFLGNGPEEFRPLMERALARNLCRETGAVSAVLKTIYHDTASVDDVLSGKSLNEPDSFHEVAQSRFTVRELSEPYQPPLVLPPIPEPADPLPRGPSSADRNSE
jgi:hypothetical protein